MAFSVYLFYFRCLVGLTIEVIRKSLLSTLTLRQAVFHVQNKTSAIYRTALAEEKLYLVLWYGSQQKGPIKLRFAKNKLI